MDFDQEFRRFIQPGADRIVALAGMLAARGLDYRVIRTGKARHLAVRLGRSAPSLVLVAHYDRVEGSPGVLDNSCACLQLADFAARFQARELAARSKKGGLAERPGLLVVFSDAEEAPGTGGAAEQGSLSLARALVAGLSPRKLSPPPALVLDVTGRGGRLLFSSASAELFARGGLRASHAAGETARLLALCRKAADGAGLIPPLEASLPWSDDLGLVLGGMGALTASLLPEAEAEGLAAGTSPATWAYLHGPGDSLALAEEAAFATMAAFLDSLAENLPENAQALL